MLKLIDVVIEHVASDEKYLNTSHVKVNHWFRYNKESYLYI